MNQDSKIIIVGAGISGIVLANLLLKEGFRPSLFEKSAGVGGRIATRRFKNGKWDHGIPWIDEKILPSWLLEDWKKILAPARCTLPTHLISEDGLTQLPKSLISSLDIQRNKKVTYLKLENERPVWVVEDETGEQHRADCVILTFPAPQALELLERSELLEASSIGESLKSISYRPQIVFLVELEAGTEMKQVPSSKAPFELVVNNGQKGIQNSGNLVSVYCDEPFSREYFDKQDEWLNHFAKDLLKKDYGMKLSHLEVKRWRYSRATRPLEVPFLEASGKGPLFLIGDGFCGGDLRGSLLSAWNLAQHFLGRTSC